MNSESGLAQANAALVLESFDAVRDLDGNTITFFEDPAHRESDVPL